MFRAGSRTLFAFAFLASPALVHAFELCPTGHVLSYKVAPGETRVGDAYLLANSVSIGGTHRGDLLVWTQSLDITGTVTGDVFAAGQYMTLEGTVGDSVRFMGQTATVNGTIEGDLLAMAGTLLIGPKGHVTGNLLFFGQAATLNGQVDGDLKAAGGEVTIGGKVGRNAYLKCEAVHLMPDARIEGDLTYRARKKLDLVGTTQVGGRVLYEEKKDDEEKGKHGLSLKGVLWWMWHTLAALVVGLLGLALFRRSGPEIAATVGTDAPGSLGVGFITAIVVPVAAILICLFVVTIPLAILALFLYFVAVYIAKLPVALWLGQRVLRWLGRAAPSSYAALLLGTPLLYLVFKIPYLGKLAWFGCLCLGLGAIILGTRNALRARRAPAAPPAAPSAPAAPATT